jgi:hypothetical protein
MTFECFTFKHKYYRKKRSNYRYDDSLKKTLEIIHDENGNEVITRHDICKKCSNEIGDYFGPHGCYHVEFNGGGLGPPSGIYQDL